DIQFEEVPADYTSLRLVQLPENGGDTLWASGLFLSSPLIVLNTNSNVKLSGYDLYDRFSKPYQRFFDGLTATYIADGFLKAAESGKSTIYDQPRGSPENVGKHLSAIHPIVRTNPVTGWKSLYGVGNFPKIINELDPEE